MVPNPVPPRPSFAALRDLAPSAWRDAFATDPAAAARWLRTAALFGVVEAQTLLAQMLLDGRGVSRNAEAAATWFASAAGAAYPPAMNMLGRCLERGWGVPVDHAAAAGWYRRAAETGLDWAQYNLANALLRGRGVARDRPAAWDWFLRAARQGHAKSMNLVARFLEEGWDRPADPAAALAWYRAAADAGDYRAQYNVGTIALRLGHAAAAARWFYRALENATPDVLEMMADGLATQATAELQTIGRLAHARGQMRRGSQR